MLGINWGGNCRVPKILGFCLLVLCLPARAEAETVQLLGAGASASCGVWLSDRQENNFDGMLEWALGYLSAIAVWEQYYDPLNGVDAEAVTYWLDDYCRVHPTDKFTTALLGFVAKHPK
jgi:hypothetical protein